MESSVPLGFWVIGVLPALAGAVMVVRGGSRRLRGRRLVSSGRQVSAIVVDNRITSHERGRQTFDPVVEFFTTDETLVRAVVDKGSHRSFVPGTRMTIFHDPEDPSRVASGRSGVGAVQAIVGVFFVGFSLLWLGAGVWISRH